jgi:hypothetical protein
MKALAGRRMVALFGSSSERVPAFSATGNTGRVDIPLLQADGGRPCPRRGGPYPPCKQSRFPALRITLAAGASLKPHAIP